MPSLRNTAHPPPRRLRVLAALLGLVATASIVPLVTPTIANAAPGGSFDPDVPYIFLAQGDPRTSIYIGSTDATGALGFDLDDATGTRRMNALAYDTATNYLYAIDSDTKQVIRIGQDNVGTVLLDDAGDPVVVPASAGDHNAGAIGDDGLFYVAFSGGGNLYAIDVSDEGGDPGINGLVGSAPLSAPIGADIAASDGYLWTMIVSGGTSRFYRVDPGSGQVLLVPLLDQNGAVPPGGGNWGAAWTYGNGLLGFANNTSGRVLRISVANPTSAPVGTVLSIQNGQDSSNNDGAASPGPDVDLSIDKTARHITPTAAGNIAFDLTVTNESGFPSSDNMTTDVLPVGLLNPTTAEPNCSVALRTGGVDAGRNVLTCFGGPLAAGASETFTVIGTWSTGVACQSNSASVLGNEADPVAANNTDTLDACLDDVAVTKSSEVSDDGKTVTYTVTVENTSNIAYTSDYPLVVTDNLSGVLNETSFNADLQTSYSGPPPASGANWALAGTNLTWRSPLGPGETATITYSVTVMTSGATAPDFDINNTVCADMPHLTSCDSAQTLLPNLVASKGASPADGSLVAEGDVISYTLTFSNLDGKAEAAVDYTDTIVDVLDDADLTTAPVASSTDLTVGAVTAGAFRITGTVPAGASHTVTYQFTIPDDAAQRGDHGLRNFLGKTGTTPPLLCNNGDPMCTTHVLPYVSAKKLAFPADGTSLRPGERVTYHLVFENLTSLPLDVNHTDHFADVVDDADMVLPPSVSTGPLLLGPILADRFDVIGTLQPGESSTVLVTFEANPDGERGDSVLRNYLVPLGQAAPTSCVAGAPLCTLNAVGQVAASKSVSPGSGTTVAAGDELTYTLTFDNSDGQGAAAVDHQDRMAGMFREATFIEGPTSSDASLAVNQSGSVLTVTGSVPPGEVATVTYTVRVNADGSRGDNMLTNFLLPTGATLPTACAPGDPACTVNPISELVPGIISDPSPGAALATGDLVTYTLTFSNEDGMGPASVDHWNALTELLDDLELVSQPVAGVGNLAVSQVAGGFGITGTVPAGETYTVTYVARVLPEGSRGDNLPSNFLLRRGDPAPPLCDSDTFICTLHFAGELIPTKSVDPESGTKVSAGDELVYTLTFSNQTGTAPVDVDYDDEMAGVLDDATFVSIAADPGLTATPIAPTRYNIVGSVDPGEVLRVVYRVNVNPAAERTDNRLDNYLVGAGEEIPDTCDDALCTSNPATELAVTKSVDPKTGSEVSPGDLLTYILTFKNESASPSPVDYVDHLAGVLDDAELVSGPTSGSAQLTASRSGDELVFGGSVAGSGTTTVEYQVRVRSAGDQGDLNLLNFVLAGGVEPPAECGAGELTCTTNPVRNAGAALELKVGVVSIADTNGSGTTDAGDVIAYRYKVTNTGGVRATNIKVSSDLVGALTCPKVELAEGESMDCTGPNYTITKADLANGGVTNAATVTAETEVGAVADTDDVFQKLQAVGALPDTGSGVEFAAYLLSVVIAGCVVAVAAKRRRSTR